MATITVEGAWTTKSGTPSYATIRHSVRNSQKKWQFGLRIPQWMPSPALQRLPGTTDFDDLENQGQRVYRVVNCRRVFILARASFMAYYLVQAKPTPEFWSHALSAPEELSGQWVNIVVGRLGGKIHSLWASFGEFDITLICELPDHVSAAALSLAYTASGIVVSVKTTALLTLEEAVTALHKASSGNS